MCINIIVRFAGFLPIEELLYVKLKHLIVQESNLEILILRSNTDSEGKSYNSRIKLECCSVKNLEGYLQKVKLDISNHKESPLICRVFKTAGHKISKTKGISYSRIRETF